MWERLVGRRCMAPWSASIQVIACTHAHINSGYSRLRKVAVNGKSSIHVSGQWAWVSIVQKVLMGPCMAILWLHRNTTS